MVSEALLATGGVVAGSGVVALFDDLTSCVLLELQPVRKTPASNSETTARTRVLHVRLDIKHQPSSKWFLFVSVKWKDFVA